MAKLIIGVITLFLASIAFAQDSRPASKSSSPTYLQILNGIYGVSVNILLDDQSLIENSQAGQRLSTPAPTKSKLKIVNPANGASKTIELELEEGNFYTLIVGGDFTVLTTDPKQEPQVRLVYHLIKNDPTNKSASIRVDVLNGIFDESIKLFHTDASKLQSWEIPAFEFKSIPNLPLDLMLTLAGERKKNLYLTQESDAKNIAIVLFKSGSVTSFKATTESNLDAVSHTPEPPVETP